MCRHTGGRRNWTQRISRQGFLRLNLMKFHYYSETDSLYIELTERSSVDSREVSPGVVLDYDSDGILVGIDIDNASTITDLSGIEDTKKKNP